MASAGVISVDVQAKIQNFVNGLNTCTQKAQAFSNNLSDKIGGTDYFAPMRKSIQETTRDLRQITQGILLAQGFYRTINLIQSAVSAVWDYTDALNSARIAFGNLFSNYELASEFVSVLQDYATRSPFDFTDVEQAAMALRAYGIESQNLMFVIQGIGNLAAVTGDYSTTFERVARAIGQINTKGKLMSEEMRQLAEAGLNVDSVYQRLGISAGEVADANIDSATAINAIIDVLNDEYSGAVTAANTTVQGMLANMRDLALSIMSSIVQPLYESFRSMLYTLSIEINKFQSIFQEKGLAQAISDYFGPQVLQGIQNFLAIVAQVASLIYQVAVPALRIFGMYSQALSSIFTALIAVATPIVSVLASIANAILNNVATSRILQGVLMALATAFTITKLAALGMMVLQVIQRIISFVTTVATAATLAMEVFSMSLAQGASVAVAAGQAWVGFASALNVNPIILAITVVLALVSALIGLKSILGGVSNVAANMSSFKPSNFLGSIPAASGDINKFNNRLSDTNDQLNDMQDNLGDTGKAAEKAVEGLLSFDEVFSLPENGDSATSSGALGDLGSSDYDVPDLSGLGGGFDMPDVPLFNWEDLFPDYIELQSVWDKIVSWFKELKWDDIAGYIVTGLTAMLSTIGFDTIANGLITLFSNGFSASSIISFFTNPATWKNLLTGLKNGLIAGILSMAFDFVFDTIADKLREAGYGMIGNIVDALSGPLSSGIATFIVTKNPFLAAGTAVCSAIFQSIEQGMSTGDWSSTASNIAAGIGGVLTKIRTGSPIGMFLGFGSIVTDGIFGAISQSLEESGNTEGADIAKKVGGILSGALSGAAIGAAFGPIGAAVGAVVGGIVATISEFWDQIANWWETTAWPFLQNLPSNINNALGGIPSKMLEIGTGIISSLGQGIQTGWANITAFFGGIADEISKFFANPGEWLSTTGVEIITGLYNGFLEGWNGFTEWLGGIKDKILGFFADAFSWLFGSGEDTMEGYEEGNESGFEQVKTWFTELPSKIGEFFSGVGTWLFNAGSDLLGGFLDGIGQGWTEFTTWLSNLPSNIGNFFSGAFNWLFPAGDNTASGYESGVSTGWSSVDTFFSNLPSTIGSFFSGAASWLTGAGEDVITGLGDGLSNAWSTASQFFSDLPGKVTSFFSDAVNWLFPAGEDTMEGFQNGADTLWTSVSSWLGDLPNRIVNMFSNAANWLVSAGQNLISGFKTGSDNKWPSVTTWLQGVPGNIQWFFSSSGQWLISNGNALISGLWQGATNIWSAFWGWFSIIPSTITGIFSGSGSWLWNAGYNIGMGLYNGVVSVWNSFSSWFSSIPQSIVNMFSGAGNWLWSAGWNIITGLWNGAVSQFNNFIKEISNWGSIIASHKGPEEYDRKLLVPNGQWIMSGLKTSMEDEFPSILDAMQNLGPKIAEAFSAPDVTMNNLDIQPKNSQKSSYDDSIVPNPYYTDQQNSDKPILYVGTLIADKQGLRELYKKLKVVQAETR